MNTKVKLNRDVVLGTAFILFGLAFIIYTYATVPAGANVFPYIALSIMVICGLCILFVGLKHMRNDARMAAEDPTAYAEKEEKTDKWIFPWETYLGVAVLVLLFWLVGYYIAAGIFLACMMVFYKNVSKKVIAAVIVVYLLVIYFGFVGQLNVPLLPLGQVGVWLGIR